MQYSRILDLHGLTWVEALPSFIEFYNFSIRSASSKTNARLEIVHGYGSTGVGGTLGKRLRAFLDQYQDRVEVQLDENPGHTYLIPLSPLPEIKDMLAENIIAYCDRPRSESKITGKFRTNGEPAVLRAIEVLKKQGRLSSTYNGRVKTLESV